MSSEERGYYNKMKGNSELTVCLVPWLYYQYGSKLEASLSIQTATIICLTQDKQPWRTTTVMFPNLIINLHHSHFKSWQYEILHIILAAFSIIFFPLKQKSSCIYTINRNKMRVCVFPNYWTQNLSCFICGVGVKKINITW